MQVFDSLNKFRKYLYDKPGVYIIINNVNNDCYVGSAKNLYRRLWYHRNLLFRNNHLNKHLQSAINKYGINNFEFKILHILPIKDITILMKLEQSYIDSYKPKYNIQPFAYLNRGYKHSEEAIEKIRRSGIGRRTNNKIIYQFDKQVNFIKEWDSIISASRNLLINSTNIHLVCKNVRISAGGFIWKYKTE
jgi:hypothetical protein